MAKAVDHSQKLLTYLILADPTNFCKLIQTVSEINCYWANTCIFFINVIFDSLGSMFVFNEMYSNF